MVVGRFDPTGLDRRDRGRPGELEAIAQLKPHYQIEDPGVALRLAVDLPNPENTKR